MQSKGKQRNPDPEGQKWDFIHMMWKFRRIEELDQTPISTLDDIHDAYTGNIHQTFGVLDISSSLAKIQELLWNKVIQLLFYTIWYNLQCIHDAYTDNIHQTFIYRQLWTWVQRISPNKAKRKWFFSIYSLKFVYNEAKEAANLQIAIQIRIKILLIWK